LSTLREDFPDDGWKAEAGPKSLEVDARDFTGHAYGAHLYNLVFAKPHTGCCEIQSSYSHETYWNMSRTMRLHAAFVRIPNMEHFRGGRWTLPSPKVKRVGEVAHAVLVEMPR
jgi:hypothetical protein